MVTADGNPIEEPLRAPGSDAASRVDAGVDAGR
jgi:hypothetical protein